MEPLLADKTDVAKEPAHEDHRDDADGQGEHIASLGYPNRPQRSHGATKLDPSRDDIRGKTLGAEPVQGASKE
jgi:hypothetical protein